MLFRHHGYTGRVASFSDGESCLTVARSGCVALHVKLHDVTNHVDKGFVVG